MKPAELIKRFRELDGKQQAILIGGVLAALVVGFAMFFIASRTTYTTLASGLNPKEAGEIAEALDSAGIENRLASGGTTIEVPSKQLDRARVAMATSGRAPGSHVGFEIFDQQKLGATDFQQQIQYQRALEGELARTIEEIDGVNRAQVQLVLARERLFTDEGSPSSASVLLDTGQAALDPSQVKGIARLVQGAVEGLKLENITITDQTGTPLWPTAEAASSTGTSAKHAAEARYAAQLTGRLNQLLTQTVGPGKGRVEVSVDLNMDKTREERLTYGDNQVVLEEETATEQLEGNGQGGGPAAGTNANMPNVPTYGVVGGGETDYTNDNAKRTYGVDKTVTKTEQAQGQVNRLSVAVLLDRSVPAADVAALEQSLSSAAGIQPDRGDELTVTQIAFSQPQEAQRPAPIPQQVAPYLKYVALGLGVLLFLFFTRRALKRREEEEIELEPMWLQDLERPQAHAHTAPEPPTLEVPRVERQKGAAEQQVERLTEEDPAQIAQQIKYWMNS